MSARDELAREIFIADNWRQATPASLADWKALVSSHGAMTYAHHIAEALIAAGYERRS